MLDSKIGALYSLLYVVSRHKSWARTGHGGHTCNLSYSGVEIRGIVVQDQPR
jgi:hypothetical protein